MRSLGRGPRLAAALAVVGLLAAGCAVGRQASAGPEPVPWLVAPPEPAPTSTTTSTTVPPAPEPSTTTTTSTTLVPGDGRPAAERALRQVRDITGALSPKSVVWSGGDLFLAQNMIYLHTISVYDRAFRRVAVISDRVRLADFGHAEHPDLYRGGPVEAVVAPGGRHAYVSNYEMSGPGFDNPGNDTCGPGEWDPSFVYRVDLEAMAIDQVIKVGSVPKYVAVTPDGRFVLVSNWCSYDLSVIDTAAGREVRRVPIGRFPRGIVVSPDGRTAVVTVMGGTSIVLVDLATFATETLPGIGRAPRHVVQSPDGSILYVTLNGEDRVVKYDLHARRVVARVDTGDAPRSMEISDDGTALYVVNYNSHTLAKVRTDDMAVTEVHETAERPIGVAYDAATRHVWVATYSGHLQVFADEAR